MSRYLITCDLNNYDTIKNILADKQINIHCKMDNHDGTYDFIIMCDEVVAKDLEKDMILIADKIIDWGI